MNLTINELKKRAHYQSGENWEKKYEKPDEIEQSIERKKKQELLHKLMDKMPLKYKTAVILRYQEELSYQEIADILHISVNLAKVRVHRGIEKLRSFLPEKDNEK
jgi:RNA polymerase sigma-70 factor (ECF subfamily)